MDGDLPAAEVSKILAMRLVPVVEPWLERKTCWENGQENYCRRPCWVGLCGRPRQHGKAKWAVLGREQQAGLQVASRRCGFVLEVFDDARSGLEERQTLWTLMAVSQRVDAQIPNPSWAKNQSAAMYRPVMRNRGGQ